MTPSEAWIARDAPWLGLEESAATGLLAPVAAAYGEPQRHYHSQTHLGEMLEAVHALRPCCRDFRAVLLAAWFHDGVYQPERGDNEARSAAWAAEALPAAGFPSELVTLVEGLVLGTDPRAEAPIDTDGQVLADADRQVWSAGPMRYAEYARGIRAEYARFSWTRYARGRGAFLARALRGSASTGRIYFHFGHAEEQAARRNLAREQRCLALPRVWLSRLAGRDPLATLARE